MLRPHNLIIPTIVRHRVGVRSTPERGASPHVSFIVDLNLLSEGGVPNETLVEAHTGTLSLLFEMKRLVTPSGNGRVLGMELGAVLGGRAATAASLFKVRFAGPVAKQASPSAYSTSRTGTRRGVPGSLEVPSGLKAA